MIEAGVAQAEVTPPAGLAMAGFAARTAPASGSHDALTVRAVALGSCVILVADVIGVDRDFCARIGAALGLGPEQLMIAASHTHGGPASMPGRLSLTADPGFMEQLAQGCIQAAKAALAARAPTRLRLGSAAEPGFAKNRRHADGPVDRVMPILRLEREDGTPYALLTICACHPVVLGADNLLWTADYPYYFRAAIERALPGVMAITATGFCGDVNTGHSAAASLSTAPQAMRTYAQAQKMGEALAEAVLAAPLERLEADHIEGSAAEVSLNFRPAQKSGAEEAAAWRAEAASAPPQRAQILQLWADWAEARLDAPGPYLAQVQSFALGPVRLIGLPGEIFAQAALDLRAGLSSHPAFLFGYAGDNPGYIAPAAEYPFGGYEIDEAHRLYGLPAGFDAGSSERLVEAALKISRPLAA